MIGDFIAALLVSCCSVAIALAISWWALSLLDAVQDIRGLLSRDDVDESEAE